MEDWFAPLFVIFTPRHSGIHEWMKRWWWIDQDEQVRYSGREKKGKVWQRFWWWCKSSVHVMYSQELAQASIEQTKREESVHSKLMPTSYYTALVSFSFSFSFLFFSFLFFSLLARVKVISKNGWTWNIEAPSPACGYKALGLRNLNLNLSHNETKCSKF